jgi:hypothetical protein
MGIKIDQASEAALRIFRGAATTLDELLKLGAIHQRENRLDDARRLFEKALLDHRGEMSDQVAIKVARDLIVCTYKDPDLPADTRLRSAEQMLEGLFGQPPIGITSMLQSAVNALSSKLDEYRELKQDLLGIAGAVEKRRWEIFGLRAHLVRAYQYYLRGHQMGCALDQGYNGFTEYGVCGANRDHYHIGCATRNTEEGDRQRARVRRSRSLVVVVGDIG